MGCGGSKAKEHRRAPASQQPVVVQPTAPVEAPRERQILIPVAQQEVIYEPLQPPAAPIEPEPVVEEEVKPAPVVVDVHQERIDRINAHSASPFFRYPCSVEGGEARPCFEDGLVYIIRKEDIWYVHNDTPFYEAQIDARFGPLSEIRGGEHAHVEDTEDGWHCVHITAGPLSTHEFVSGSLDGYKVAISARLIRVADELQATDDEAGKHIAEMNAKVMHEMNNVKQLVSDPEQFGNSEMVLQECVSHHVSFVDLAFAPEQTMLSVEGKDTRSVPAAEFRRPCQYLHKEDKENANKDVNKEEEQEITLFAGPIVPQSIAPSWLGNTWFTSALAILAENEHMIHNIFTQCKPEEMALNGYRLCINKNGLWRNVIVDDYFPTRNEFPLCAHSTDCPEELWMALLEKAYAKLHGSYASITGGDVLQALQDLTGFTTCRFNAEWEIAALNCKDSNVTQRLWNQLHLAQQHGHVMVLGTPSHTASSYLGTQQSHNPHAFCHRYEEVGLKCGYSYYVRQVIQIKHTKKLIITEERVQEEQEKEEEEPLMLFEIRNPWLHMWNKEAHKDQDEKEQQLHHHQLTQHTIQSESFWAIDGSDWVNLPEVQDQLFAILNSSSSNGGGAKSSSHDGFIWISWESAINYFDGGGILYCGNNTINSDSKPIDYRVEGHFIHTASSVAVQLTNNTNEPLPLQCILSQCDKRGVEVHEPAALFAPIMLSVARLCNNDNNNDVNVESSSYVIEANTSFEPEHPSGEYNFAVARDVSMIFNFAPHTTYLLIPRIHWKGVESGFDRPYTVGIIAPEPLCNGLARVEVCKVNSESCAFKNLITFSSQEVQPTCAHFQIHQCGLPIEEHYNETVIVNTILTVLQDTTTTEEEKEEGERNANEDVQEHVETTAAAEGEEQQQQQQEEQQAVEEITKEEENQEEEGAAAQPDKELSANNDSEDAHERQEGVSELQADSTSQENTSHEVYQHYNTNNNQDEALYNPQDHVTTTTTTTTTTKDAEPRNIINALNTHDEDEMRVIGHEDEYYNVRKPEDKVSHPLERPSSNEGEKHHHHHDFATGPLFGDGSHGHH